MDERDHPLSRRQVHPEAQGFSQDGPGNRINLGGPTECEVLHHAGSVRGGRSQYPIEILIDFGVPEIKAREMRRVLGFSK